MVGHGQKQGRGKALDGGSGWLQRVGPAAGGLRDRPEAGGGERRRRVSAKRPANGRSTEQSDDEVDYGAFIVFQQAAADALEAALSQAPSRRLWRLCMRDDEASVGRFASARTEVTAASPCHLNLRRHSRTGTDPRAGGGRFTCLLFSPCSSSSSKSPWNDPRSIMRGSPGLMHANRHRTDAARWHAEGDAVNEAGGRRLMGGWQQRAHNSSRACFASSANGACAKRPGGGISQVAVSGHASRGPRGPGPG